MLLMILVLFVSSIKAKEAVQCDKVNEWAANVPGTTNLLWSIARGGDVFYITQDCKTKDGYVIIWLIDVDAEAKDCNIKTMTKLFEIPLSIDSIDNKDTSKLDDWFNGDW